MIRLSGLQLRILEALAEYAQPSQQDVATAAGAHQSSVSRSVRKLIAAGLVARTAIGYEITPNGSNVATARTPRQRPQSMTLQVRTLDEVKEQLMLRVYGGTKDFGVQLCTEMHQGGLTFDTLAAKWGISLPLLGVLIADHCYKLTAVVDDKVHTENEYHNRFDFTQQARKED